MKRNCCWLLVACFLLVMAGCSWQGQRHYEFDIVSQENHVKSEWWSMRFCWVSAGIESYTKTDYYQTGAVITASRSDPNSISATGEAAGTIIGAAAAGAVRP